MSLEKKKIIVLAITTIVTVIISIGAATYTWFTQQAATDEVHKFPATGYEILMFEADVSDVKKEGTLYPAKIKDEYLVNGIELTDYETYPMGDFPDYLKEQAGVVSFKNDLSFWGSIGFGPDIYKPVKIEYNISIKQDEEETKSHRLLNETEEAAARIEFFEHDNQIHVADLQYTLLNGQFLKEGSVVIKNINEYNIFDRALDDRFFQVNQNHKSLVFGDYAHSMFSPNGSLYYFQVPYSIELPDGQIINPRYPDSAKMNLSFSYNEFIVYKENGNSFVETLGRFNSLKNIGMEYVKIVKNHSNLNMYFDYDEGEDLVNYANNILIPASERANIVIYSRDDNLFIEHKDDYVPKSGIGETGSDIIYFKDNQIKSPPVTPLGMPVFNAEEKNIIAYGGGIFIGETVNILQKNVFYSTNEEPPAGVNQMLIHKIFNENNFEVDSENLVYCVIDPRVGASEYPKVKMIDSYYIKNDSISYIRNNQFFHTYNPKYELTINDYIIQINYRSDEVLDGEKVVDDLFVVDLDRGMLRDILFDDDAVIYKQDPTPIRYIDKSIYYEDSDLNRISFIDGKFPEHLDTISGLKNDYGRYFLDTVNLLESNIVVLRDGDFRVFTHYTAKENDIELFYYIPSTETWYINDDFSEYFKMDDGGIYYLENISLFTNDYAYKDANTGYNHIRTIMDESSPSATEDIKPIVWNKRLVMSRDTTYLLDIGLYLTTFAHETSRDLNGETLNFYIVASFEDWDTMG